MALQNRAKAQPCILYHHPLSLCSKMVRYSLAIAGTPAEGMLPVSLELYKIDIVEKNEQFTELYLCEVNPKGQVGSTSGSDHGLTRI